MDGNGRWPGRGVWTGFFGHQQGVNALREIIEAAAELKNQISYPLCVFHRKLGADQVTRFQH